MCNKQLKVKNVKSHECKSSDKIMFGKHFTAFELLMIIIATVITVRFNIWWVFPLMLLLLVMFYKVMNDE